MVCSTSKIIQLGCVLLITSFYSVEKDYKYRSILYLFKIVHSKRKKKKEWQKVNSLYQHAASLKMHRSSLFHVPADSYRRRRQKKRGFQHSLQKLQFMERTIFWMPCYNSSLILLIEIHTQHTTFWTSLDCLLYINMKILSHVFILPIVITFFVKSLSHFPNWSLKLWLKALSL